MPFVTIDTRTSDDIAIPYEDINSLMGNTQYFKDGITVDSGNVGIGGTPDYKTHIMGDSGAASVALQRTNSNFGGRTGAIFMVNLDDIIIGEIRGYGTSTTPNGGITFHTYSSGSLTECLDLEPDGDAYFVGDVSALSFTDRTPFYEGDALSEIKLISGKDGEIDHDTLPEFSKVKKIKKKEIENEETGEIEIIEVEEDGRDLGACISMNQVAIQQLVARIEDLEKDKTTEEE